MLKKKFKIFGILTILLFFVYFFISSNIGNNQNKYINIIDDLLSQNTKNFLKETIFIFKYQKIIKKELADKDMQLADKDKQLADKDKQLADKDKQLLNTDKDKQLADKEKLLVDKERQLADRNKQIINLVNDSSLIFQLSENSKIENSKFKIIKYTNSFLKRTGPRAYFETYKDNLLLITGTGTIMHAPFNEIKGESFVLKRIQSNFRDIVATEYIHERESIVVNMLIKNNKIYISYIKKLNDECYMNSILVSNFNLDKIHFEEFFVTNECTPSYENTVGGNIVNYKDNKILMTIGDWHSYEKYQITKPQIINNIIGKIISIDELTKEYKILSMGHRNPQGLFYDNTNDIIFFSEHGPQGGDEININMNPEYGKVKNYGWAISSYGDHYGFPEKNNEELYKVAPLHKSHKDYGFIEPLKYFTPSIATSQIVKTEEFVKLSKKHIVYVGAMGKDISEGDMSLHQVILDENFYP